MGSLDGSWLEPRYSPQVAAIISANWTNGSEPGVSVETQLILEVLMVLMCLGAVTGTDSPADSDSYIRYNVFIFLLWQTHP